MLALALLIALPSEHARVLDSAPLSGLPVELKSRIFDGERWLAAQACLRAPDGWRVLSLPPQYNFQSLQVADVDGDGQPDLALTTWSKASLDPNYRRRLFIYGWDGQDVYPKWRGSRLSKPLVSARIVRVQDRQLLLAVEEAPDGREVAVLYRWTGFGFAGLGETAAYERLRVVSDDPARVLLDERQIGAVDFSQGRLRFLAGPFL